MALAEAIVAARGAGPDPAATAATMSERIIATRESTAEWAKTAIRRLWATVNPYDSKQVEAFTVQAAGLMESAQTAVSRMAAAGQAQQLAAMGIPTDAVPSNPLDVRAPAAVIRKGKLLLHRQSVGVDYTDGDATVSKKDMTTQGVLSRPAMVYRYAKSQGAPDADATRLAYGRIDDLVDNNLMLAQRYAEQEVLVQAVNLDTGKTRAGIRVIGYRRIIHPELSRSGVCGICIAASDRIYTVGKLLPIHDKCKCTTAAVTEDYDPADDLNAVDLSQLYKDAGGTSVAHLKRTRYKEDEHGELGPVVVPRSKYKPRTTKSKVRAGGTALQSDQPDQVEVATHQLRVMEENLARLRSRGEPEDSSKVVYHEKLIAKLRKQAEGDVPEATPGGGGGGSGGGGGLPPTGGGDGFGPDDGEHERLMRELDALLRKRIRADVPMSDVVNAIERLQGLRQERGITGQLDDRVGKRFDANEQTIVDRLLEEGRNVTRLPQKKSGEPTPDMAVDGKLTEIKTTVGANVDWFERRLIDAQSPRVIINMIDSSITPAAMRAMVQKLVDLGTLSYARMIGDNVDEEFGRWE